MITLQKTPGKDFVVLNLTDPQLGNYDWNEDGNCRFLKKDLKVLCERLQPDLITLSGDLAWAGEDISYDNLAALLDETGIPWAPVWGNHDNQDGAESVDAVATRYLTHPLCVYEKGDPALGNGNYVIAVEEEGNIVSALIMMDSHDRAPYVNAEGKEDICWAKLIPAQMEWYQEQIAMLAEKGCHDTTIIMHIPFYAYRDASVAAYKAGLDMQAMTVTDADGEDVWNDGYKDSVGVQYEGICSYNLDDGVFPVICECGSTKHVIVGHDHVNNWIISYKGVKLVYGLKTGCGCYWNPCLNGGTVLRIGDHGVTDVRHEYVDITDLL